MRSAAPTPCGRSRPSPRDSSAARRRAGGASSRPSWTWRRSSSGRAGAAAGPPRLLFVGVLERYKAVEVLADAWRLAAPRIPTASLHLVGRGTMTERAGGARGRVPGPGALDAAALDARGGGGDGRRDRARCSRRAPRGFPGSWWSRSAAAAPWSARARVASPTSSWTARTASSSRPRTQRRWPMRMVRLVTDAALASGSARAPRRDAARWLATPGGLRAAHEGARGAGGGGVRAIFVTQEVDPASPVLGATVAKIRALAACVDEVAVLADRAVDGALPGELHSCACSAARTRAGRGLRFEAALAARARPPPAPLVRARAHVPHLRRARRTARAPARRAACSSGSRTGAPAGCSPPPSALSNAVVTVEERTFPLPSRKVVAIGHGIDLAGFPCVERAPAAPAASCWPSAGRRPPRGSRRSCGPSPPSPASRLDVVGPSLTDEERAPPRRARAARRRAGRGDRVRDRGRGAARRRCRGLLARGRRARQQHACRRDGQGRLRGGRHVPARARLQSGPRRLPAGGAALRAGRPGSPGGADPLARGRRSRRARARAAGAGRARPLGRGLGAPGGRGRELGDRARSCTWARCRGSPARRRTCSCSSRSCASGASTFASCCCTRTSPERGSSPAPARGLRRPGRGRPPPARRRPDRVSPHRRGRAPPAPGAAAHAPRARRLPRPARGPPGPRAGAREHEARLQPVPARRALRRRRPNGRQAPRPAHRDLRGPGPLPGRDGGVRGVELRDRPLRHRARAEPEPHAGDAPRLAVVGRLVPIKGHDTLLRASPSPHARSPGLELEIAGSRAARGRAARPGRAALGLDGTVRFLGQVPGAAA